METLDGKIKRVTNEEISVVPYSASWPAMFQKEKEHLRSCLPSAVIGRIEHFGSTAVPGLCAKPIIDMLVEVTSLDLARECIAPVLEKQGYDYFWRPTFGDSTPPFYAWFIKRNSQGSRTHHIHMVETDFDHWDRLLFRDFLIDHPEYARRYGELKTGLARIWKKDRIAYTEAKHQFIELVTERAKNYYKTSAT